MYTGNANLFPVNLLFQYLFQGEQQPSARFKMIRSPAMAVQIPMPA